MKRFDTGLYILMIASVLLSVSCKRQSIGEADSPSANAPLRVKACLTPATRTAFDTDGLTLLWEAGDEIAVYSSFLGNETTYAEKSGRDPEEDFFTAAYWLEAATLYPEYSRYGKLTLADGYAGGTTGKFASTDGATQWFGNPDSKSDDYFWFTAFYPARSSFSEMSYYLFYPDDLAVKFPVIKVEIPSVQDGKNWNKYQFVACCGYDILESDPAYSAGKVTRQDILGGTGEISFNQFSPMTSILAFQLKVDDTLADDPYYISKIVITQEATWEGQVRDDLYALSGVVPYFPFCDDMDEDGDTPLWNRYVAPVEIGNNYEEPPVGGSAWPEGLSGLCNSITLDFSSAQIKVGKTLSEDTYYAVTIPTNAALDEGYATVNPTLIFTAYDENDNPILKTRLRTPTSQGLMYGRRYDFPVILHDPSATVQDEMLLEASAGDYHINPWN